MVDSNPAARDGGASETESDQKHAHLRTHPRAEMVILFGLARRPASTQIEKVSLFYRRKWQGTVERQRPPHVMSLRELSVPSRLARASAAAPELAVTAHIAMNGVARSTVESTSCSWKRNGSHDRSV